MLSIQTLPDRDLSPKRTLGFACNQAFIFTLFYLGKNTGINIGDITFERTDLLFILACMVVGFAILRAHTKASRHVLLIRPLLYVYAIAMAVSMVSFTFAPGEWAGWQPLAGAALGLSASFMLTAWGRAFGMVSVRTAVLEVFTGSLIGAGVCLLLSLVAGGNIGAGNSLGMAVEGSFVLSAEQQASLYLVVMIATIVVSLLPLVSAALVDIPAKDVPLQTPSFDEAGDNAALLSFKVLIGTLLFGAAAGYLETYHSEPGGIAVSYSALSFLLFGAFVMGALSLLISDGFGKGASLTKSYRIAIFMMLFGVIMIPLSQEASSVLPGEAIVLAGYLSLQAVLISLFLVLAKITGVDPAVSFPIGFVSLFSGEWLGVAGSNVLSMGVPGAVTPYASVAIAGALVLFGYVFLFTERDFLSLSEMATSRDSFEVTCAHIAQVYKLSKREAEILPYALRGRTAERIAQELSISKSTVDTHLRRIYAKAQVHSRQELIDLGEREAKAVD